MTAATIDTARPAAQLRGTARPFLTAEWIKLRTLRSTSYTLLVAAFLAIGIGALACQRFIAELPAVGAAGRADRLVDFDAASQSLVGMAIAQLAIGTLGVLVVTSEFGTGQIRATLAAMPQRRRWMAAKLAVFTAVAVVVSEIVSLVSFLVGQAVLGTHHVGGSLSNPANLRAVVLTGVYVALVGLLGAAFGLLIRHTAGALSTLLGVLFVLPGLLGALPQHLQDQVAKFLPLDIGQQASTAMHLTNFLTPWVGIAVLTGYAAVLLGLGGWLLQRRDA